MTEEEIKTKFEQAISKSGVHNQIGVTRYKIYNWRRREGQEASLGEMLAALYRLELITITSNDKR